MSDASVDSHPAGHDIAEDFWEHGADTTIVQRSSTYVVSSEHGLPAWLNGFYDEGGPPTEDAEWAVSPRSRRALLTLTSMCM